MPIARERFTLVTGKDLSWFGYDFAKVLKYGLHCYMEFKIFNQKGSLICAIALRPYST